MRLFEKELVDEVCAENHVADLSRATIGETLLVAEGLEKRTGIPFIRMDQGSPAFAPLPLTVSEPMRTPPSCSDGRSMYISTMPSMPSGS